MMRAILMALAGAATLAAAGAADAKTVYPYDRDECFPYGREVGFSKADVSSQIKDKRAQNGVGGALETVTFLGVVRSIAKFEHAAEQCRLRRKGQAYDRRCPVEIFPAQWMVDNAPDGTWSRPRGELRQATSELDDEVKHSRASMKKACAQ